MIFINPDCNLGSLRRIRTYQPSRHL